MGQIINITRFCTDDGPGIRTTVFLKGCPLECLWCHNPESQKKASELMYSEEKCVFCGACTVACANECHSITEAGHSLDREKCIACGKCAKICKSGALEIKGDEVSAELVLDTVLQDAVFYESSGGGVTVTGGEALYQPEFTAEILRLCRQRGIHTAIETCGFASPTAIDLVAEWCDLVLFDIKETDPNRHILYTGAPLEPILEALRRIDGKGIPIILRLPIIPGLNDREEHFAAVKEIAKGLKNLLRVEVMPYHRLGEYKYGALGREYKCAEIEEPTPAVVAEWRELFAQLDRAR